MAGVGDWGRSMNPREKAGRRRWKGRWEKGRGRSVRHEGATRRTVDVRGDRLGAAGHSTLATPRLCNSFLTPILLMRRRRRREISSSHRIIMKITRFLFSPKSIKNDN